MNHLRLVKTNSESEPTSFNTKYPRVINETIIKLTELAVLENDWDSYGGGSPSNAALIGASVLAFELFEEGMPRPDVFPVPNGNIQYEWSCFNIDLEIEIESRNKCYAHFEDLQTGEFWEKEFIFDFTMLRSKIAELTKRNKITLQAVNG